MLKFFELDNNAQNNLSDKNDSKYLKEQKTGIEITPINSKTAQVHDTYCDPITVCNFILLILKSILASKILF